MNLECADLGFHKAASPACTLTAQILITPVLYSIEVPKNVLKIREQYILSFSMEA